MHGVHMRASLQSQVVCVQPAAHCCYSTSHCAPSSRQILQPCLQVGAVSGPEEAVQLVAAIDPSIDAATDPSIDYELFLAAMLDSRRCVRCALTAALQESLACVPPDAELFVPQGVCQAPAPHQSFTRCVLQRRAARQGRAPLLPSTGR